MRFTPWATRLALTLSLSATAFLTACGGGGGGSSNTQVRLLNATQSYASLDLSVNDKTINSKVAYATVGTYGDVDTNASATRVLESTVGTSVSATTPTLTSGSNYTFISYGWAGAVRTTLLQEAETAPDSGKAKLLILNLAPDAGNVDVYVTTPNEPIETATAAAVNIAGGSGSGYVQLNSGTFQVRVTGYNRRTDLRLNIPSLTLDSASVNTLILTATDGGLLVNGMRMVQKGAVTNFANTQSRMRTVGALSGGATVSATVNGQTMLPTALSPSLGEYQTTTSGAATLAVNINGSPITVAAPTLKAGGDYTLLVWGDAATPKISVITDDNRLPSISGNVKVRLINALASAPSGLTLNLDYSAVASNVLPGTSSTPASTSSTTASLLEVSTPTSITPVFRRTDLALVANGVYTVFVFPNPTAADGTLRKER